MDLIAHNIANAQSTRTDGGGPYRRRVAVLAALDAGPGGQRRSPGQAGVAAPFAGVLGGALAGPGIELSGRRAPGQAAAAGAVPGGVQVVRIAEDPRPFRRHYDPTHPDADGDGYVLLPNVDVMTEMVDLISASRAYEANVAALQAAKAMAQRALDIGR